ncbi:hypothetical protein HQ533_05125 [Candidatus Woesearchaeota archaeon]|nr:hypothetical protein [Candidatus Woesearchaeota archaeon]
MKKHMSKEQEFDIMKLVLDKFLWIGVIIMGFGFYKIITLSQDFWYGFSVLIAGAVVMFLFTWLLVKEYHFMK